MTVLLGIGRGQNCYVMNDNYLTVASNESVLNIYFKSK